IYRFASAEPEPKALLMLSMMVVLALSSYAQCLFGLDGETELTRYRLMPLRGWEILVAKDIALLVVVLILTTPLAPLAGLAAASAALAMGYWTSIRKPVPQLKWRFCSGSSLLLGILQTGAVLFAGCATFLTAPWIALISLAAYGISLIAAGREFDKILQRYPNE
ncbi:MAG: hypothetical protein GY953_27530, partial [bacterium]|nr:hypothetical protein [bacterium]